MPDAHAHDGFEVPAEFAGPAGAEGGRVVGRLVGAAFDGCQSCQAVLLGQMAGDAGATARLVELACLMIDGMAGGLPANLTDPAVPGLASAEFRQLAAAGADGANQRMYALAGEMTRSQRRAAADSAVDILTGALAMGGGGDG